MAFLFALLLLNPKYFTIFAPAIPRRGCLRVIGWGSRHIKKAFIDALFWCSETSQLSYLYSGLSNGRCPTGYRLSLLCLLVLVHLLRICVCAHAYLNYVAREYIYIRRGLRVVGLIQRAMRRPRGMERRLSSSALFFCMCMYINGIYWL